MVFLKISENGIGDADAVVFPKFIQLQNVELNKKKEL